MCVCGEGASGNNGVTRLIMVMANLQVAELIGVARGDVCVPTFDRGVFGGSPVRVVIFYVLIQIQLEALQTRDLTYDERSSACWW